MITALTLDCLSTIWKIHFHAGTDINLKLQDVAQTSFDYCNLWRCIKTFQLCQFGQKYKFVSEQVTIRVDNMQNISTKVHQTPHNNTGNNQLTF